LFKITTNQKDFSVYIVSLKTLHVCLKKMTTMPTVAASYRHIFDPPDPTLLHLFYAMLTNVEDLSQLLGAEKMTHIPKLGSVRVSRCERLGDACEIVLTAADADVDEIMLKSFMAMVASSLRDKIMTAAKTIISNVP
jgi:hypothetical protein